MWELGTAIGCCNKSIQDCIESKWLIQNQESPIIYRSNEIVTATGVIDMTSATEGIQQITVLFWINRTMVTQYTLQHLQSFGFTVSDFDTIQLVGNGCMTDIARGNFTLIPRYRDV